MGELSTLALCWRLERRDGVAIGLTAHDRDLVIDGLVYRAAPGMTPSAIRRTDSLEADSMEARGALTSAAITERDLLAERWAEARIRAFAIDWSDAAAEPVMLGEGTIGTIEMKDGGFSAELRGLATLLSAPVVEATSPGCRARLGDRRCRVPMAGRRRIALVAAADGVELTMDAAEPTANAYGVGMLRWLGGANSGLEQAIAYSDGAVVTLREVPYFVPQPGDRVELIEGCDRRLATCAERFGNAVNFQGEPHLPGIDLLTRYPGA